MNDFREDTSGKNNRRFTSGRWVTTIVMAILLTAVFGGTAQSKWQKERIAVPPVVCYASGETGHAFVPPPPEFLNQLKSAFRTSDIIVSYTGFPDSARIAFEYAVEIWESLLSSQIPIYMEARWAVLGTNTLGSCGANNYYKNFEGAPLADTYYPGAIVEKITRKEISGKGNPDMSASFNSTIPWYFGTDGKAPAHQYDFVSTVLHEIAHGLGFTGFLEANTSNLTASYGYNDALPAVFDRFIENFNGKRLTDQTVFTNPSNELYKSLVSNQLYSGSPVAYAWGFENRPRLFAPYTFKEGSSIYHLNDQSYPYGTNNALMTPSAGKGEVIHSPGPLTSGILADLGWKHLYFTFIPLKDREETGIPLEFETRIESDAGIEEGSVYLVYSTDGFIAQSDSIPLLPQGKPGNYRALLDPGPEPMKISYFLSARDSIGRVFTSPSGDLSEVYTINLGPDTIAPRITHDPLRYILSTDKELVIEAGVTDNIGVDTVYAVFSVNGTELPAVGLIAESDTLYRGTLRFGEFMPKGGDTLAYVLYCGDKAGTMNITRFPAKKSFSLPVEDVFLPVTRYTTGFDLPNGDFVLSDFKISTPAGFDNAALHSPHPYPSPDADDKHYNLYTLLRYPVVVAGIGLMAWDEVVLVEPAEEGAVFGDDEFWDYVIAEGSKDYGKTWLPLLNGYDSGSRPLWKSTYNQSISGNNSTSKGTKGLFARREFRITQNGNFKDGDTILVRFRLYSDPYAHGWGWAIDNLEIQQNITSQEITIQPALNFLAWPNPAKDFVDVALDYPGGRHTFQIQILTMTGTIMSSVLMEGQVPGEVMRIDLSHLPAGFYVIALTENGRTLSSRKLVKM